jgi:hypothetical protein
MLKFLFWSLLLANAVLFAYQRGYLGTWISDGHEPARRAAQFNPDKIRQIPASAITAASSPVMANAALAEGKPEVLACTEIGNFDEATAKRFEAQLLPLALGDKLSQHQTQEARNMVYIPSLGSKEAADKKAIELRHLGVSDFYVIQEAGELHWGISLGIFKTEDGARALLAALNLKGVRSARVGIHNVGANKVAFQVRNLDAEARAGLDKITLKFAHVDTRNCEPDPVADNKTVVHAAKETYPRDAIH